MAHPIIDSLLSHIRSDVYPMHVPGHKQGRGSDSIAANVIPQYLYKMDMTEIPGLDDLHEPSGCIREAESQTASLFGADRSFLLVNGSTAGVEASILATCPPGSRIAVSGVIHQSVIAGVALSGAQPIFMDTMVNPKYIVPLGVEPAEVERCLVEETAIGVVLVTNPSYYGVCQDLESIADICHRHGAILIVDEAHGSHLAHSSQLPVSGLEAGADVVIQSTHKTLGAMTQAALLHVKGSRVDHARIASFLRMIQTSSPSYVLMASLDSVIHGISLEGERLVALAVENAQRVRDVLQILPGVDVMSPEDVWPVFALDPTRVTVSAARRGVLGIELQKRLRARGFQVEFSDFLSVVAVITYSDGIDDLRRFCSAVEDALDGATMNSSAGDRYRREIYPLVVRATEEEREFALSVREAVFSSRRRIGLDECVGEVSAESVCPYPPGIPLVIPGQTITRSVVDLVKEYLAAGLSVHGIAAENGALTCTVVKGPRVGGQESF